MDATSSVDLVHTQVHPRRPWRTQGPRPSVRGSDDGRRRRQLQDPDIRPLETSPTTTASQPPSAIDPGHPASTPDIRRLAMSRTSGIGPGNLYTAEPESNKTNPASPEIQPLQPGHPALRERLDIWPVARTSGLPCLRAVHLGRGPCTPSPLRLYILPLHLRFRVSVVIAHLRDRASLIHIGSTP